MSRYLQPAATAVVAAALIAVALYFQPPQAVAVARGVGEATLHDSAVTPARRAVAEVGYTIDQILLLGFVIGLFLILIGSLGLIWHRSLPIGRHRLRSHVKTRV